MNKLLKFSRTATLFMRLNVDKTRILASKFGDFNLIQLNHQRISEIQQVRWYVASKKSKSTTKSDVIICCFSLKLFVFDSIYKPNAIKFLLKKYAAKSETADDEPAKKDDEYMGEEEDDEDEDNLDAKVLKSIDTSSFPPGWWPLQ